MLTIVDLTFSEKMLVQHLLKFVGKMLGQHSKKFWFNIFKKLKNVGLENIGPTFKKC
jgi:hypothetical protein